MARRPWLLPLAPVYGAALAAKNRAYDLGLLKARRLGTPVISVGSISAGGAGKTPVTILLAKLLEREGLPIDVLSRGYGRSSRTVEAVPLDDSASGAEFGDEPIEMTRAGLHVFVGAERYEAGKLAERTHRAAVHLLDDGFQHRRLARVLDVVLLTAEDIADRLLPAGNLREPLAALERADVVVLREEEAGALRDVVRGVCRAEIWEIRRELEFAEKLERPFAFCGIARPESFFGMLRDAGREPVGSIVFRDHHRYEEADIRRIVTEAKSAGADGIYLTEKDAVKIPKQWMQELRTTGAVDAPNLHISLKNPHAAVERMRTAVQA
jgi:tetraacyldisaccharide 4'-kinase